MGVELRVLGPLEIAGVEGRVALPGRKQRRLLAALALAGGRACSPDDLVEALWGEAPPASARKLVQLYVSQLRRALPDGIRIGTRSTGYALELDGSGLDSTRLERLAREASEALTAANPELGLSLAEQALGLWRGPAYADVAYDDFARDEARRLEELRLAVTEDRLEALLRLGRHGSVLAEALALADAEPLRQRLQELAMLALYRAGRQSDALDRYAALRRHLDEELGLEPTPALRELQRRILQQDPSLDVPSDTPPAERVTLPLPPTSLVGRERELGLLADLLARRDPRLLVLTGAGGSGKTRLALEAARRGAGSFANGTVLVELAPLRDPSLVPQTILSALAATETPGDDPLEALLRVLEPRELLLVVDNAEHLREAAPLYVELVSRAPRLTVLVTSRSVLHVSGEHVFPVQPLDEEDAVELFEQRARALAPAFRRSDDNRSLIAEVCERVDRLPLAIELAAGRIGTLSLAALRERLGDRLAVLTGGPRDLPARQRTLREALAWSVGLLTPSQRAVLARLAAFPGGATLEAAEEVCGADLDTLAALVDTHLVRRVDAGEEPRFGLLETVREYALGLLGDERADTEQALVRYFLEHVETAEETLTEDPAWLARFDVELDNLRSALDVAAAGSDPELEVRLAGGLWRFWWTRGFLDEGLTRLGTALERATAASPGRVRALRGAAGLAWSRGDLEHAVEWATDTLAIAREIGSPLEEIGAHTILGIVANQRKQFEAARGHHEQSLAIKERLGLEPAVEWLNLGIVALDSGDPATAVARFEAALAVHRRNDNSSGIGFATLNLGLAQYRLGDAESAQTSFQEARAAFGEVGFRAHVAHAVQGLAACAASDERHADAARLLGEAAAELAEIVYSEEDFPLLAAETEAAARHALGDEAFDAAFTAAPS